MVEPSETPRNLPVTAVGQSFEAEFSQPSISKNSHSGKNSSKNGKRRLAVTRGFDNSGLSQLNKSSASCNKKSLTLLLLIHLHLLLVLHH